VIKEEDIDARSFLFFKNLDTSSATPMKNHIQLVAAGSSDHDGTIGTHAGLTSADNPPNETATNRSWVFRDAIVNSCSSCTGTQLTNYIEDVLTHELAHQWNVNKPQDPAGHDSQNEWNDGSRKCLMNESRDRILGVARFHANLAASSKDLYCIRGHVDDLNQDTCTWP
jgi:hypothetical protein